MIRTTYRRWLGFLKANYPPDLSMPPAERITIERVRTFIDHLNTETRPSSVAIAARAKIVGRLPSQRNCRRTPKLSNPIPEQILHLCDANCWHRGHCALLSCDFRAAMIYHKETRRYLWKAVESCG